MNETQHTLKEEVSFSGVGLHKGESVEMRFLPASPGHGLKFQRIDLPAQPIVAADLANLYSTKQPTILSKDEVEVWAVEHTLAALAGMQIDNALVTLSSPEPPIMDGSAKHFVEGIKKAGLVDQKQSRSFLEIQESILYKDQANEVELIALPFDKYRITVTADYKNSGYSSYHISMNHTAEFEKEIALARKSYFIHELKELSKQALWQDGSPNSVLVLTGKHIRTEVRTLTASHLKCSKDALKANQDGLLCEQRLRFPNELARHKLLELVGDLALLSKPLKAHVIAIQPSRASNIAFAKEIRKKSQIRAFEENLPKYDPNKAPIMGPVKLKTVIPHKYPFLLVDNIFHLDDTSVAGIKNLTYNEPFFQGHFPDNPIMPGVLQVEVIAQVGSVLLRTVADPKNHWIYFLAISNFRFRKTVVPGDTLVVYCKLVRPVRHSIADLKARAYVARSLACEGEIRAAIVPKNS